MAIRYIAAVTALAGFYLLWWTVSFAQTLLALFAIGLLLASAGLFLGHRWGAYLWFLFAVGITLWWLAGLAHVVESGWPFSGVLDSTISLLPGLLLIGVCISGIVLIYRKEFKRERAP